MRIKPLVSAVHNNVRASFTKPASWKAQLSQTNRLDNLGKDWLKVLWARENTSFSTVLQVFEMRLYLWDFFFFWFNSQKLISKHVLRQTSDAVSIIWEWKSHLFFPISFWVSAKWTERLISGDIPSFDSEPFVSSFTFSSSIRLFSLRLFTWLHIN